MGSNEQLEGRVSKLEEDVTGLRVETAKIGTSLDSLKERAAERHEQISGVLTEIKTTLSSAHPGLSGQSNSGLKWVKEVLTPQTIAILLAVLASAFGAPMVAQQVLGQQGLVLPPEATAASEVPVAPAAPAAPAASPAAPAVEAKPEKVE